MSNKTYIASCIAILVVYFAFLVGLHIHNERSWREFQRHEASFRAAHPSLYPDIASNGN